MMKPDKIIVFVIFLILSIGALCLYSSCHQNGILIKSGIFHKQLLWQGLGICILFLCARFDYRRLSFFAFPFYVFTSLSLLFVLVAGRSIMGAQRWISLGIISFQPSEFGKFVLILALAHYFSQISLHQDIRLLSQRPVFIRDIVWPLCMTMFLTGLVLIQPDLGTSIVYIFIFFSIIFLAGVSFRYIGLLSVCGVVMMPFFWHFLKDYQKSRLLVFLNPNIDPLGAGYTVIQSKIAIGSGGLFGKGWLSGTQSQLNFLAERHTDFIFSVIGEEWGFFGSFVLIFLFCLLISMILEIAQASRNVFGKLFCVGVACVIFFHVFINIAMNVGACPVVGLPLPFISYGGSSLVINLAAIGIVLNIARQERA